MWDSGLSLRIRDKLTQFLAIFSKVWGKYLRLYRTMTQLRDIEAWDWSNHRPRHNMGRTAERLSFFVMDAPVRLNQQFSIGKFAN